MSFKSKQRAKHGLLFGDDPLNAISTTSSTIKSMSKTPIPSSSSSSSTSRTVNNKTVHGGSIFGGIDVSKFGNKRNNPRSSTSLRPTSSLLDDDKDDIDHLLFGGRRKPSTSSSLAPRNSSSSTVEATLPKGSPHNTILVPTPLSSPQDSLSSLLDVDSSPPQSISKTMPTTDNVKNDSLSSLLDVNSSPQSISHNDNIKKAPRTRRPASTLSKSTVSPLVSSSTSSLSSFSSTTTNSSSPSSPVLANTPPPPPPRTHKKHLEQQQDSSRQQETLSSMDKDTQRIEDDRMQQQRAMMEDEGTRAFATITPTYYDDPELCSSFTQSLSITPPNVSFTPDMPTTTNNTNDDPWAPPALLASTSTTDLKNDIEPAKQAAFADLIAQWHGARQEHTRKDPDDHFFDHVACEQRDIAFAGIGEPTTLSSFQWQQQDTLDNPWSS